MVWDRGTWTPEYDAHKGLKKRVTSRSSSKAESCAELWHPGAAAQETSAKKRENWLLIKSGRRGSAHAARQEIFSKNYRCRLRPAAI